MDRQEKEMSRNYQRFRYTEEQLKQALSDIRNGLSLNEAHRVYGIPKSTLHNKIKNKVPEGRKMGSATYLSQEEENRVREWILNNAKVGFPLHPNDVKDSVQKVLKACKRPNPFTDDRPGVKWFNLFLNRRKDITLKNTNVISKARARVTEKCIRSWFTDLETFLKESKALDVLKDPRRLLNCDETGVMVCPKSGKLLSPPNT